MHQSQRCCRACNHCTDRASGVQDLERAAAAFNMESDLHAAFLATPVDAQPSLRDEWKVYSAALGHLKARLPNRPCMMCIQAQLGPISGHACPPVCMHDSPDRRGA